MRHSLRVTTAHEEGGNGGLTEWRPRQRLGNGELWRDAEQGGRVPSQGGE
jgi:hypothetical protein